MNKQDLDLLTKIRENSNKAEAFVKENTTLTDSTDVALAAYVLNWYGEDYDPTYNFFKDNPITLPEIEKSIRLVKKWRESVNLGPIGCDSLDREVVRDGVFLIKGMREVQDLEYGKVGEFIKNNL